MSTSRPRRSVLVLLLALAAWLTAAGTAQAHTGLTASTPAEGSTVTEPLAAVTLTRFSSML